MQGTTVKIIEDLSITFNFYTVQMQSHLYTYLASSFKETELSKTVRISSRLRWLKGE
jgi:hypothetical protein